MSITPSVNERLARAHRRGDERLARPDPAQPDHAGRRAASGSIEEDSLRGVTSNPAIFEKAILGSATTTTTQIARARARGRRRPRRSTRRIAIQDVQVAADVLRPVYDDDRRRRRLRVARGRPRPRARHRRDDRAGARVLGPRRPPQPDDQDPRHRRRACPAIEQTIYEGININVTLLFTVESYDERSPRPTSAAMERRRDEGKSLDVHSVASFFVSRVDTEVDKRLEALGPRGPAGHGRRWPTRAPPTRSSRQLFQGERFAALRDAGAPVQRPLWASTGVKNPHYPDDDVRRRRSSARTRSTRCRCATLLAARRAERGDRPTADDRPDAATCRRWPTPASTWTTSPTSCSRDGIDEFVDADGRSCSPASRPSGEASSPAAPQTIEASIPDELRGGDRRARAGGPSRTSVAQRIWAKDDTLWGGPRRSPRSATASAGSTIHERHARRTPTTCEAFAAEVHADGLTDAVAARHGRLEPGARGVPPLVRHARGRAEPARARLDRPRRRARRRGGDRPGARRCSSSPRSRAGRSRRCRTSTTSGSARRATAAQFVAVTDPGTSLGATGPRARLPPRLRERPEHRRALLRAVVLRPRARRADGRRRRGAAAGRARWRSRAARGRRRRANSGLWLGVRARASWRSPAATS